MVVYSELTVLDEWFQLYSIQDLIESEYTGYNRGQVISLLYLKFITLIADTSLHKNNNADILFLRRGGTT